MCSRIVINAVFPFGLSASTTAIMTVVTEDKELANLVLPFMIVHNKWNKPPLFLITKNIENAPLESFPFRYKIVYARSVKTT